MKARQYAEAIYLAAQGKDDAGLEAIASRVVAMLKARGHGRLLPRILSELEKVSRERAVMEGVSLRVASRADAERYAANIARDLHVLGAATIGVDLVLDDTLIGGYEVRCGGRRLDRSYKHALVELYETLINA